VETPDAQTHFILTGNLWRVLFRLAWPAVLGMVLFGLNGFIDAVYVGRLLGERALGGVSLAVPLMQIQLGLGALVGTGAGAVLSLAIGRRDGETQRRLWGNLVLLTLALSLPATLLTVVFARPLVTLMGGGGALLDVGARFFQTYAWGTLLTVFGLGGNMLIRGEGKLKESMLFAALGLLANVVLNPLFIRTFGWGVEGAALATLTANGIMGLCTVLFYRFGKASFAVDLRRYRWDPAVVGPMAKIGVSSFVLSVMTVVQALVVFGAIARHGTERDVAFYGAANRLLLLTMTPAFGLMRALQPVVGINYGAGQYTRVKTAYRHFTGVGTVLLASFFGFMVLFSRETLAAMLPATAFTATEVLNFRILILPVLVLSLVFTGLTLFQSVGNAKAAGLLATGRQLVLFIPAVWLLSRWFGVSGIYYAQTGVDFVVTGATVVLVGIEFRKMTKKARPEPQSIPAP
jgi:putative MATE family efflux protein